MQGTGMVRDNMAFALTPMLTSPLLSSTWAALAAVVTHMLNVGGGGDSVLQSFSQPTELILGFLFHKFSKFTHPLQILTARSTPSGAQLSPVLRQVITDRAVSALSILRLAADLAPGVVALAINSEFVRYVFILTVNGELSG